MEDLRPVVDLTGKEFETALSGISKGMSSVDTAPVVGSTLINSGVLLATMSTLISPDVDLAAPSLTFWLLHRHLLWLS
jgi:hypothetical protein